MFRYIALVWNRADSQQADAAELLGRRIPKLSSRWQEMLATAGMRVFCADRSPGCLEPRLLSGGTGVVLGAVFERNRDAADDTPSPRLKLDETHAHEIVRSRGQWLIDNCWGNYVAFIADQEAKSAWILKDPTGTLPCFSTPFRGTTVIFGNVEDCVALQVFRFAVDRTYLRSRMVGGTNQSGTALSGVEPLHRGACMEIATGDAATRISKRFYWNPLTFANGMDPIDDAAVAARAVRATVRSCTNAWASGHSTILHRLSGGLDSSIIAGCLKDAPSKPRVTCYTYFSPRGRSDERPWARLAAQHAGYEHLEHPVAPEDIRFDMMFSMPHSTEPAAIMGYLQRSDVERRLTTTRRATAVFTGDGGDSGFCSGSIRYAVPEYLRRYGLHRRIVSLASQVALTTGRSTAGVLTESLRRWLRPARVSDQQANMLKTCRLVSRDIRESYAHDESRLHPWFSALAAVPWATVRQVGMLVCASDFYNAAVDSDGFAPDVISPLYSQPVVELLLRIPVHVHFAGGRDRGLARRAFEQEVPAPILRRLWKDRAPGFYDELLHRNRDFLRELFLDGVLVSERLLDRSAVEEALSTAPGRTEIFPGELFRHMEVELWVRQWTQAAYQQAAA
jgi:asparagine synthase (glutamine-hydrolysing)